MDKKTTIILVAVVVVIVAIAAAAIALNNGNDGDDNKKTSKATGRLAVYGNANNDDYLDEDDVKTLEDILATIAAGGSGTTSSIRTPTRTLTAS